jgi:uncharacterized protein YhfF
MSEQWWSKLNQFSFGDTPQMADELALLVIGGVKTGTSWHQSEGQQTQVGQKHVVLDGEGSPVAIIETVELRLLSYDEVDEAFAYDSGEDDRTLSSWRAGYRNYYERQGKYAPDMLLYCERFKVIEIIKSVEP